MKKIWVLYTGGTIGMVQGEHGLRPDTALAGTALVPFAGSLHFDWHVCQPLIDSSAVQPRDWAQWRSLIEQKLPDYDGVLVLHGTDTLAYTANLLALTLHTQNKPVILTGAQKPFNAACSDAPNNLRTAVEALQRDDIHEVLLAFDGRLFPAVGSSKVSTETDAGFANHHFGTWQPQHAKSSLHTSRSFNPDITVLPLWLTPAHSVQAAAYSLRHCPADAAVLMSYGHGNAPDDAALLQAMRDFTAADKPLLNISQVAHGCAAAVYAQGNALRQSGAVQGGKCTIETATVLLMLAVHHRWNAAQIEQELQRLQLL